jgi:hypothetical protein
VLGPCHPQFAVFMFNIFSRAPVSIFAKELTSKLVKRYSPTVDQQANKKPSVNRLTRIVEETLNAAVEFQQTHGLGWYGKSKLANEFRWALTEAGYTKEFVDFATEAMVVYLNQRTASKSA